MARHRTVSTLWQGRKPVAYIRLTGRWLEELGFEVGSTYEVMAERGRLVLVVREPSTIPGNADGRGTAGEKHRGR